MNADEWIKAKEEKSQDSLLKRPSAITQVSPSRIGGTGNFYLMIKD